jgi:hypothetical protein
MSARCCVCFAECKKKCSKCNEAHYCGADHQKQDWLVHKTECGKEFADEDERQTACNQLFLHILKNDDIRESLGQLFRQGGKDVFALSIGVPTPHHFRMTMTGKLTMVYVDDKNLLAGIGPLCMFGYQAGKEYVLHIQVGREEQPCAQLAMGIPFSKHDEPTTVAHVSKESGMMFFTNQKFL